MRQPVLKAFNCRVRGTEEWSTRYGLTAGKARYEYLLHLDGCYPDLKITEIEVRRSSRAPRLSERLERVAELRGLPFRLYRGMRIAVEGKIGVINDGNDSLNLDVCFEYDGHTANCHPTWETVYFDREGKVIADYTAKKEAVA